VTPGFGGFMPAGSGAARDRDYRLWVEKYGEEQAKYLLEVMAGWANNYTHGVLIDFDFTQPLRLDEQVRQVCAERGWQFDRLPGDLGLSNAGSMVAGGARVSRVHPADSGSQRRCRTSSSSRRRSDGRAGEAATSVRPPIQGGEAASMWRSHVLGEPHCSCERALGPRTGCIPLPRRSAFAP